MAIQHAFSLVTCTLPLRPSTTISHNYRFCPSGCTAISYVSFVLLLVLVALLCFLLQSSSVDDVPDIPRPWDWIFRMEFGLCSPKGMVQIETQEDSQVQLQVVSPLLPEVPSSSTIYESAMSLSFSSETDSNMPGVSFRPFADDSDQVLPRGITVGLSRSLLCPAPSLNSSLALLDAGLGESFSCFTLGVSDSSIQTHQHPRPSLLAQRISRNPAPPIVTTSTSPSFDCPT